MQTGTRHPTIPPRVKFQGVSVCFGRFGRKVHFGRITFLGFDFYFFLSFDLTGPKSLLSFDLSASRLLSPLCFDLSTSPSPAIASSFKPSTTSQSPLSSIPQPHHSRLQLQAFNHVTAASSFKPSTTSQPPPAVQPSFKPANLVATLRLCPLFLRNQQVWIYIFFFFFDVCVCVCVYL